MNKDELHKHPAFRALSADEQNAVDQRLETWHLDIKAIAATTGALTELEPSDLRFWLASTHDRPWAMISLCKEPEQANAIFDGLLTAAPQIATHPDRASITDAARDFSRSAAIAEANRKEVGFVRDEQLAALSHQIDKLASFDPAWSDEAILGILRLKGFGALADVVWEHKRSNAGVRGFFERLGAKLRTRAFDISRASSFVAFGKPDHEGYYDNEVWRKVAPRVGRHVMERRLLGGCAFLLFVTFGMLSGVVHAHNDKPNTSNATIALQADDIELQDIVRDDAIEQIGRCSPELYPASDPAGHRECVEACKAGGKTLTVYCTRMPTPQFVAMCLAAAALGTVSCMGFCYSRFME